MNKALEDHHTVAVLTFLARREHVSFLPSMKGGDHIDVFGIVGLVDLLDSLCGIRITK